MWVFVHVQNAMVTNIQRPLGVRESDTSVYDRKAQQVIFQLTNPPTNPNQTHHVKHTPPTASNKPILQQDVPLTEVLYQAAALSLRRIGRTQHAPLTRLQRSRPGNLFVRNPNQKQQPT